MKSDKDKRIVRLLKILLFLDQGSILPETFAKEEGLSLRTIQRDIEALQVAGFPLTKVYNSRWTFEENFNLQNITKTKAIDPVLLTDMLNSISPNADKKTKFLEKNKNIGSLYSSFANKLYTEHKYKAALDLYKRALSFNKQDTNTKLLIAQIYIELQDYKNALKTLQAPAETKDISKAKILCYMNLGQDEKALKEIDTYLSLLITNNKFLTSERYNLLSILYRMGEYEKALKRINENAMLFPDITKNLYYMLHLNIRLHNLEKVKEYFITYNKIILNKIAGKNIYYKSVFNKEYLSTIEDAKRVCINLNDKENTLKYCKLFYEHFIGHKYSDILSEIIKIYNTSAIYLPPNAKTELYNLCNETIKISPIYKNYFARALVAYMFKDIKQAREDFYKCAEYILKKYENLSRCNSIFLILHNNDFDTFYSYLKPIIPQSFVEKFNKNKKKLKLKLAMTVLENTATDIYSNILAGRIFQEYGKNKEAIICLKRGLNADTYTHASNLACICRIYHQKKDKRNFETYYQSALQALNKKSYEDNFSSHILWIKAEFLYDIGNYKTAFLYFQKGFKLSYFDNYDRSLISEWKDKFIDCCRKLNENAAEKEFLYLYQTTTKYAVMTHIN